MFLVSADVTSLKHIPFFPASSTNLDQGEDDDLLVYIVTYPLNFPTTPITPSPDVSTPIVSPLVKPYIL